MAVPTPVIGAGVTVVAFSASSVRGGPASVTASSKPDAQCSLQQVRNANGSEQRSPLPGAALQTVSADGGLVWIWVTDPATPLGAQLIEVNCGAAGSARFTLRIEP